MTFRERLLNTLRGRPVDRLPFVELGPAPYLLVRLFSDWNEHLAPEDDPRKVFGFDNLGAGKGYKAVPLDQFAVPRFPERAVHSDDKYERKFIPQWGCVARHAVVDKDSPFPSRVLEGHAIRSRDDWLNARDTHFRLTTNGRFPENWSDWCAQNRHASVPIALQVPEPEDGVWNLLGDEGETGLFEGFHSNPELIAEIAEHLSRLYLMCIEKALAEAPVDMVIVNGSDLWPFAGPRTMKEFFFPFYEKVIGLARNAGVDLICLSTRIVMKRDWIDLFVNAGVNGVRIVEMTGDSRLVRDVIAHYGNRLFYIGNMDGRILTRDERAITAEVRRGIAEARTLRAVPCLASDHILPDVPYAHYRHYIDTLREEVFGPAQ